MIEIIKKKEAEKVYEEKDLVSFLSGQINGLKITGPKNVRDAERSGRYTFKELAGMKDDLKNEVDALEALLKHIVSPPMKQSGCQWKPDKYGGFRVEAYISALDMSEIKLPNQDAELFQDLIDRNIAVSVLSAMAIIFGYWEKQRGESEKRLIEQVNSQMGNA